LILEASVTFVRFKDELTCLYSQCTGSYRNSFSIWHQSPCRRILQCLVI